MYGNSLSSGFLPYAQLISSRAEQQIRASDAGDESCHLGHNSELMPERHIAISIRCWHAGIFVAGHMASRPDQSPRRDLFDEEILLFASVFPMAPLLPLEAGKAGLYGPWHL